MAVTSAMLELEIEQSRRRIRIYESQGQVDERALEEARLAGLLQAVMILGGSGVGCVHPRHSSSGLDERGRTIWICVECGAEATR